MIAIYQDPVIVVVNIQSERLTGRIVWEMQSYPLDDIRAGGGVSPWPPDPPPLPPGRG